jgi:ATPase subunit of ABC transporter with duplicated ATPase domains
VNSAPAQLRLVDLEFSRPDRTILRDLSLTVGPGDRIGLTGPNGSGKSTLLALAAGELAPQRGSVSVIPSTATVGLLRQELRPGPGETVRAWIERRLGIDDAARRLDEATAALATVGDMPAQTSADDEYDRALRHWLGIGGATLDERLPAALSTVGIDPARVGARADVMSGGERARIGLAGLMLAEFDVLLLDEPTNDLDTAGLALLEELLGSTATPFVVVSHDRRLLERTVNAVVELDSHTMTAARYAGGWGSFLSERAAARAQERRAYEDYQSTKGRLLDRARTERSWASKGANRAARNPRDGDKIVRNNAIESSENLAARARRTERAIDRLETVDKPWEPWRLQFDFGVVERSGDLVVDLRQVEIARGSFALGPLDLVITAGERVHLAGPNGCGKTSLLLAILGDLAVASGHRRIGPSVSFGVIDQRRGFDLAPLEHLEAETGASTQECRSTLAKFGLPADHARRDPAELSPGERTRTLLAAFQLRGVNTVLLDEPTNHLDIEAIEQLESALDRFRGTLIVISHDRAFLDHLAITRTVLVEQLVPGG